ncbi:2,3-diphosphoglycerate-dependent phosphoglycerate mutase [Buchnera aphidicola]|uniref:2,3-diphosphoglycerate-dependent phosphoglycerate mutase n=1 Tax=Buchnera aphidicola TaxID=9 RepID=UPI003463C05B
MKIIQVVLVRHGESEWNKLNNFTGWTDVNLSELGKQEAILCGKLLNKKNIYFDCAYTSFLKRAIHTLWKILKELDQAWIPVKKTWRLNERHYGKLQGLNKSEIAIKYGEQEVYQWRRSFEAIPPEMKITDNLTSCYDQRYQNLTKNEIPKSESLELTLKRVLPYWENIILPNIKNQKKILIVAHGNSLRALMKYLSNIDESVIPDLHIPTGVPIIYNFNQNGIPINYYFLEK